MMTVPQEEAPSLSFKVAPHAIEDLGSNLYTSFPKVLAEFVANAYDADANKVEIFYDFKKIEGFRKAIRHKYSADVADPNKDEVEPLADRRLPDSVSVVIRDDGFGMSAEELNNRFLWAARKRRSLAPIKRLKDRPLMGRKGLGKLAGFGVATVMEVVSKKIDNPMAIKIRLDYDSIIKEESLHEVKVPTEWDSSTFGPEESGTEIRLLRLGFDSAKSKRKTIVSELAEHFEFIDPEEFQIWLCNHKIPAPRRQFAFAFPYQEDLALNDLKEETIPTDVGEIKFKWRIRFRKDMKALPAERRGIRIYAKNRLAAAPSLLDADTNMHGFRMTDYLDGVVQADFIDDQRQDYIATDRQSLRWDTPLLSPLKAFLSLQIKEACRYYQGLRDQQKQNEVLLDTFTKDLLDEASLSKRELKFAQKIACQLARFLKKGIDDPQYKTILPDVVRAVGHGDLYSTLSKLAEMETLDVSRLIESVVKLNKTELDGSTSIVRSRLKAIEALTKEVEKLPGTGAPRNEGAIQKLFEEAPWLMDPLYQNYMTADKSTSTVLKTLATILGISQPVVPQAVSGTLSREPDFVFLLGTPQDRDLIIVELKASNKSAEQKDIMQLRRYMRTATRWLEANDHRHTRVRGELICTPPPKDSSNRDHMDYWLLVDDLTSASDHRVRTYSRVLEDTKEAHSIMLDVANKVDAE